MILLVKKFVFNVVNVFKFILVFKFVFFFVILLFIVSLIIGGLIIGMFGSEVIIVLGIIVIIFLSFMFIIIVMLLLNVLCNGILGFCIILKFLVKFGWYNIIIVFGIILIFDG